MNITSEILTFYSMCYGSRFLPFSMSHSSSKIPMNIRSHHFPARQIAFLNLPSSVKPLHGTK